MRNSSIFGFGVYVLITFSAVDRSDLCLTSDAKVK